MPFSGNKWRGTGIVPYQTMLTNIQARYPTFAALHHPSTPDTSKLWHVPGYSGRVGFISSMTDHFCGACNRVRITADGHLKVCLFGPSEVDLKAHLRTSTSDTALLGVVGAAVAKKKPRHAGMEVIAEQVAGNRPMILIGG